MGARGSKRRRNSTNNNNNVVPNMQNNPQQTGGQGRNSYPGMAPRRQSNSQMYVVTIPQGVNPGQNFAVMLNGQRHIFRCPPNASAGSRVHLSIPTGGNNSQPNNNSSGTNLMRHGTSNQPPTRAPTGGQQRYRVVIPQGVRPGHNFAVVVNGQRMVVTCPPNAHAGQTIEIVVGGAQNNHHNMSSRDLGFTNQNIGQPAVNRTQRYRVRVPSGVRAGQRFRINVAGRLYEVVCPPNANAGQLLELELPAMTQEGLLADSGDKLDQFLAQEKKKGGGKGGKDDFRRELKDGKVVWVAEATAIDGKDGGEGGLKSDLVVASATAVGGGLVRQLSENGTISLVRASEAEMDMKIHSWQGVIELDGQQLITASAQPLSKKIGFFWGILSSRMNVPWEQGHVKIEIRRQSMLEDSLNAFQKLRGQDFHKIFRFKFVGEEGLDAGGLAREWFTLVGKELFNPDFGLFSHTGVGGEVVMINPNSGLANEHHLQYFRFAGQFMGKALFDHQNIPIHLIMVMYKHMLGMPITVNDLEAIDYSLKQGLIQMKKLEDVSVVGEGFVVTEKIFGANVQKELKPGGNDIDVTNDNFDEYVECMVRYYLMGRIDKQLSAMLKGFYEVIPSVLLSVFDFQELELVLCGLPNIDLDDWEQNTEYSGDYKRRGRSHKVVKWFWKLVREDKDFSDEERARLLQFATGTSRVPALGFRALQGRDGDIRLFTIESCKLKESVYPRAHTCFNRIELPLYKSYDELKSRTMDAIQMELTGFGME